MITISITIGIFIGLCWLEYKYSEQELIMTLRSSNINNISIVFSLFLAVLPALRDIKEVRTLGIPINKIEINDMSILAVLNLYLMFCMIALYTIGFKATSSLLFICIFIIFIYNVCSFMGVSDGKMKSITNQIIKTYYESDKKEVKYVDDLAENHLIIEMFHKADKDEFKKCLEIYDGFLNKFFYENVITEFDNFSTIKKYIEKKNDFIIKEKNQINLLIIIRKAICGFFLNPNFIPQESLTYFDYTDIKTMINNILDIIHKDCSQPVRGNKCFLNQDENIFFEEVILIFFIEVARIHYKHSGVLEMFQYNLNKYLTDNNYIEEVQNCSCDDKFQAFYSEIFSITAFVLLCDNNFYVEMNDIDYITKALQLLMKNVEVKKLLRNYSQWRKKLTTNMILYDIAKVYDLNFFTDSITYAQGKHFLFCIVNTIYNNNGDMKKSINEIIFQKKSGGSR